MMDERTGSRMQGRIRCSCGQGYNLAAVAEPKDKTPSVLQKAIDAWIGQHGHGKQGDGYVVTYEMEWAE